MRGENNSLLAFDVTEEGLINPLAVEDADPRREAAGMTEVRREGGGPITLDV